MPRKRKSSSQKRELTSTPPKVRAAARTAAAPPLRDVPIPPLGPKMYLPILIVLAGLVVYANSLSNGFVLDDRHVIVENEAIRTLSPISGWLTTSRPVTDLTFAINYAFGGLNPGGYHSVNVLIHLLAGLTLYGLVRRTLLLPKLRADFAHASPWIALVTAIIWVVHPLQTESVAYLSQRSEALMGLFYLLTLYCVVRGVESTARGAWFAAAITCCALGMGSKAVMVTAPIAVLLFDRVVLARPGEKIFAQRGWLYLGLAATWVVLLLTGAVQRIFSPAKADAAMGLAGGDVSPVIYAMTQPGVILHYFKIAFWPVSLCFDYEWNLVRDADEAMAPMVVVGLLLLWTVWGLIRRRPLSFATAFFLLVLLPTSSFIPMEQAVSEHRMYLPLAGLVLIVVLALHGFLYDLFGEEARLPMRQALSTALPLIVVVVLGWYTVDRNRVYGDSIAVWEDVLSKRPNNVRARIALGSQLYRMGEPEEATEHFKEAVRLDPDHAEARYRLGVAYNDKKAFPGAVTEFTAALENGMQEPEVYFGLGVALIGTSRPEQGIEALDMATFLRPDYADAFLYLGNAHIHLAKHDEALWYFDKVLDINPNDITAMVNKGAALLQMGRLHDALFYFESALEIDPDRETACESRLTVLHMLNPDETAEACGPDDDCDEPQP